MKYRMFIEENFMIDFANTGELVPFKFNPVQDVYYQELCRDYDIENKGISQPVRENILKARREGFSSLILGLFAADDIMNDNPTESVVLSYKEDATNIFRKRYRTYVLTFFARDQFNVTQEQIKNNINILEEIAPHVFSVDATDLELNHNKAHFQCQTAGARVGGRGGVMHKILFSEIAFYQDTQKIQASEMIEATMRQVDIASGWIFAESTENGQGTYQHKMWVESKRGRNRFKNRFYGTGHFYNAEQMAIIKSEYIDLDAFRRDYPQTEDDLFKGSARSFTSEEQLTKLINHPTADKDFVYAVEFQHQNGMDVAEIIAHDLEKLARKYEGNSLYVGIDEAKDIDATVVYVLRDRRRALKGGVKGIEIDTTRGDWLADWFEKNTNYYVKRVKFSRPSKSLMYSNLQIVIEDELTSLPEWKAPGGEWVSDEMMHFYNQMITLEKEIIGDMLVVGHPKGSCNHSNHNYDECPYHDDYCFIAGTQVLTEVGYRNIEELTVGDNVWTRQGYKRVVKTGNRVAPVMTLFGLTGTFDHPIFTKEGVKRFDSLHVSDTLYIWNEKLLNIEEKNITDILNQNTGNYVCTFGDTTKISNHLFRSTGKFGLTIMAIFQKVWWFITRTITHSITRYLTLNYGHALSTKASTLVSQTVLQKQDNQSLKLLKQQKRGTAVLKGEHGIENMQSAVYTAPKESRVYNLQIEDAHEYVANGILVHNCDAWMMAEDIYVDINGVPRRKQKPEVPTVPNMIQGILDKGTMRDPRRNRGKYQTSFE